MYTEADSKRLDWVEQAALENIRAHIKSADDIKRETNTALTILLAGGGGALAYAAKSLEYPTHTDMAVFFGAVGAYLFGLCQWLVFRCLKVGSFPAPTNEPEHLNQKQYPLNQLREVELRNMQKRIQAAARINESRSKWLNATWIATSQAPVFGGLILLLFYLGHGLS